MNTHQESISQTEIERDTTDLTIYDQKRKQRGSIGVFNETLPNEIKREQRRSILLKLIALLYRIALKRVIP